MAWRRAAQQKGRRKRKQERKWKRAIETTLLWMEQRKWPVFWFSGASLHDVSIPGASIKGLPEKERVKQHAESSEGSKQEENAKDTKAEVDKAESYSYTYETEEDTEEEEKDEDEEEPEDQDPLLSNTLE